MDFFLNVVNGTIEYFLSIHPLTLLVATLLPMVEITPYGEMRIRWWYKGFFNFLFWLFMRVAWIEFLVIPLFFEEWPVVVVFFTEWPSVEKIVSQPERAIPVFLLTLLGVILYTLKKRGGE